jgi:hypothetical protein
MASTAKPSVGLALLSAGIEWCNDAPQMFAAGLSAVRWSSHPLTPLAVRLWHIQSGAPCGTADTASKLWHGQYRAQLSVGTPLTDAAVLTARTHT